mgnify:CR=1 FL=1
MADNHMLMPLTVEEGKSVLGAFENFKTHHQIELSARAIIGPDGTVGAEVQFFKKVELVPKENEQVEAVENDFKQVEGNENNGDETVPA